MTAATTPTLPECKTWIRPKRLAWLNLRKTCLTSTEMCGVAGLPKYGMTRFKIYHLKKNLVEDDFVRTDRVKAGTYLEQAVAKWASEELGMNLKRHADFQIRGHMGASYDYKINSDGGKYSHWLVEFKNVDGIIFKQQWGADGDEIPHQIEIQIQSQLYVSQRPGCILAVLVGGNNLRFFFIERDEGFCRALAEIADLFWDQIQAGIVPENIAEDVDVITQLYRYSDPESTLDATEDLDLTNLLSQYDSHRSMKKHAVDEMQRLKGEVLLLIGDKHRVFAADGWKLIAGHTKDNPGKAITQKMVGTIQGARSGHRQFLLTRKTAEAETSFTEGK